MPMAFIVFTGSLYSDAIPVPFRKPDFIGGQE